MRCSDGRASTKASREAGLFAFAGGKNSFDDACSISAACPSDVHFFNDDSGGMVEGLILPTAIGRSRESSFSGRARIFADDLRSVMSPPFWRLLQLSMDLDSCVDGVKFENG